MFYSVDPLQGRQTRTMVAPGLEQSSSTSPPMALAINRASRSQGQGPLLAGCGVLFEKYVPQFDRHFACVADDDVAPAEPFKGYGHSASAGRGLDGVPNQIGQHRITQERLSSDHEWVVPYQRPTFPLQFQAHVAPTQQAFQFGPDVPQNPGQIDGDGMQFVASFLHQEQALGKEDHVQHPLS